MTTCRWLIGFVLVAGLLSTAQASPEVDVAAIAQPEGAWQEEEKKLTVTQPQKSGFSLRHVRAITRFMFDIGHGWTTFAIIEAEFAPTFQLLDAAVTLTKVLPHRGALTVAAGQALTPFSRQQFTPIWKFQFAKQPDMVAIMPNRQIGLGFMLALPYVDFIEIGGGIYNGEGPNNVQNIDSKLMYMGRLAFRFFREHQAWVGALGTPMMGGLAPTELSIAGNVSYNDRDLGAYHEMTLLASGELFASFRGFSAYAEYLWGRTDYTKGAPKQNFNMMGFVGQVGYLLPLPGWFRNRFELTFRFDAVAPNNRVPIATPGDPTQARAAYTAGLNYYHRGHGIKVLLNYIHNQELDDKARSGAPLAYANDTFIVQLSYRLE